MCEAFFLQVLKVLSKGYIFSQKGSHVTKYWEGGALNCEISAGSHFSGTP